MRLDLPQRSKIDTRAFSIVSSSKDVLPSEHSHLQLEHLFAERDVTYEPSTIANFVSFVDYMSCSAETYTSLGGSNGCADQLTNWDGTKKLGLGTPVKKKGLTI